MVAILQCYEVAERLELRSLSGEPLEFSEAWRHGTWEGSKPHLALLVMEGEVGWLGRAQGGRAITSRDRVVKVTDIEEIDPLPVGELRQALPLRHREVVERVGILPPGGGRAIIRALSELRPSCEGLIDRLQRSVDFSLPRGRRGELLNLERDGVGLLLDLAGVPRRALRSWSAPAVEVPFLAGIPDSVALEDHLIVHDTERFGSWFPVPSTHLAWRAFTDGARRIFIMNANREAVEHTLGVDVVYWNERDDSFVLVQYKKMERSLHDDEDGGPGNQRRLTYRPDHNLLSELQRMQQIDTICSQHSGPFRLLPTPCWVKLCEPDARIRDPAELIKGMYFAREYFEELLRICKGPRGGTCLTYDNVPRYLNNTMFIDLVRGGWIGSRGSASAQVRSLVQESIETRHAVVFGVQSDAQS